VEQETESGNSIPTEFLWKATTLVKRVIPSMRTHYQLKK
jgi:hypothetical protein